jgi:hypothetical protein
MTIRVEGAGRLRLPEYVYISASVGGYTAG